MEDGGALKHAVDGAPCLSRLLCYRICCCCIVAANEIPLEFDEVDDWFFHRYIYIPHIRHCNMNLFRAASLSLLQLLRHRPNACWFFVLIPAHPYPYANYRTSALIQRLRREPETRPQLLSCPINDQMTWGNLSLITLLLLSSSSFLFLCLICFVRVENGVRWFLRRLELLFVESRHCLLGQG